MVRTCGEKGEDDGVRGARDLLEEVKYEVEAEKDFGGDARA